jgi:hypothetical protein
MNTPQEKTMMRNVVELVATKHHYDLLLHLLLHLFYRLSNQQSVPRWCPY